MNARFMMGVVASFFGTSLLLGSTVIPASRQQKPVLLRNATVVTVSGPALENADVLFVEGRITQVGPGVAAPAGAEIIELKGRRIYPGFVAANTHLGLAEIASIRATVDSVETGAINPDVRAQVAINPDSELLPVARSNGILTALVVPAVSPNLIAGLSALIRLDGWTWEDLTLRPMVALHVYWPAMSLSRGARVTRSPADQQKEIDERVRSLDNAFAAGRAYVLAHSAPAKSKPDTDVRWEAMRPVFTGERPVFVHAAEAKQIAAALAWAKRQKLRIAIVGGMDAGRLAAELRAADVPVILTGAHDLPLRRDDPYDAPFTVAAKLHEAGVRFCIAAAASGVGDGHGNERNLPYHAAQAAAYGLPRDEALKAVTLYAANLLGVGSELGSIETGKRATLMVTNGDPLEIPTQVEMAFIDGARIDLRNRQTALHEKYRERLRRQRVAPAAGGVIGGGQTPAP
jgi:imidazolonepropionase-like amidohydrolase